MELNQVYSAKATQEPGVVILSCNLTDMNGATYDCEYCSRPDDPYGLNPVIRAWIAANQAQIQPYVEPPPPTAEELRAAMPRLTGRQLRLGLLGAGISPSTVTAQIEAMPAGVEREAALIEWEYASYYTRQHALIATLGGLLGLNPAQIDTMWTAAAEL